MIILVAAWFLLPAGVANMMPVFARQLWPRWRTPIERSLFGSHKTYRGFVAGMIAGLIVFLVQREAYGRSELIQKVSFINYDEASPIVGLWMGFCALLGDLIKSFVKRRVHIAPGKSWVPFDQLDWIIGTLVGITAYSIPPVSLIVSSLAVGLVLHLAANAAGYLMHLNKNPI